MARPKSTHPTPGELEVLKILWQGGPATARRIWETLNQQEARHYTSVNSLLNVMVDKGFVKCRKKGRAFTYEAKADRRKTLGRLVDDLVSRGFEGSTSALVLHALGQGNPSPQEIEEIAKAIREYRKQGGRAAD